MIIVANAEALTRNSWEVWKAQADMALNPPTKEAKTEPGSAAEPLDLTSDEPEAVMGSNAGPSFETKQQADAVYKLLREWSSTDSLLKNLLQAMEKKITITQHGVQLFNAKVEAATRAIKWVGNTPEADVATAAKGESPAVLARLTAKARDEPDFRALTMSISKGVATAQTRSLFQTHIAAARRAASETRSPLQEMSPNSVTRQGKGKGIDSATDKVTHPAEHKRVCSYQSLQDFYALLDKIERTSPMGARYLEAYAERLQAEGCKDCWFSKNVLPELTEDEPEVSVKAEPPPRRGQHRADATIYPPVPRPTSIISHVQGYVDRYRAQYGQDPPRALMREYGLIVPAVPSYATRKGSNLPASRTHERSAGQESHAKSRSGARLSAAEMDAVNQRVQDYVPSHLPRNGVAPNSYLIEAAYTRHTSEAPSQLKAPTSSGNLRARATIQAPYQQQRTRLPTEIVFPQPEQLVLPSAPRLPERAQSNDPQTYISPFAPSSLALTRSKRRR